MPYKSYILTVYISCNKNTKFDDQMQFLWCRNAPKYVFSRGSVLDPTGELWPLF